MTNLLNFGGESLVSAQYVDKGIRIVTPARLGTEVGYDQAQIAADFKYSLGKYTSGTISFIDNTGKTISFYTSTSPTNVDRVFRAYKFNNDQQWYFDNDPISLTFLTDREYVSSMTNIGTYFACLNIHTINNGIQYSRTVLVKTGGSSNWRDWVLFSDVSSLNIGYSNFSIATINGVDYILRVSGTEVCTLTVFSASKQQLRAVQIFSMTDDIDVADYNGEGRVITSGRVWHGYHIAHGTGFCWDPQEQTLHRACAIWSPYYKNGVYLDTVTSFSNSFKVPASWIQNGSGTPTSLLTPFPNGKRFKFFPNKNSTRDNLGIKLNIGACITNIVVDEYTGDILTTERDYWTSSLGGKYIRYKKIANSPFIGVSENLKERIIESGSYYIPDGSLYSKNTLTENTLVLGDRILLRAGSLGRANKYVLLKLMTNKFDSVENTNDTFVVDNTSTDGDPFALFPDDVNPSLTNVPLFTRVNAGAPEHYALASGKEIVKFTLANGALKPVKTGVIFPKIDLTTVIQGTSSVLEVFNLSFDIVAGSYRFFAYVITNTYINVVSAGIDGVWRTLITNGGKEHIDSAMNNRGDGKHISRSSSQNVLLDEDKILHGCFSFPIVGDINCHLLSYNTTNNTFDSSLNRATVAYNKPTTSVSGEFYDVIQRIRSSCIGYGFSDSIGYYFIESPLSNSFIRLISSKSFYSGGAVLTKAQWLSSTESRKHVKTLAVTSSTGLLAYVTPYPIILGGYKVSVPQATVALSPNRVSYIYVSMLSDDPQDINISVKTTKTPDSFNSVCLAKITTGADSVQDVYLYRIDGMGLPDQEGKAGMALISVNGKYEWGWVNSKESELAARLTAMENKLTSIGR